MRFSGDFAAILEVVVNPKTALFSVTPEGFSELEMDVRKHVSQMHRRGA